MTDIVAPEVRSRMMAGIRGRHTQPELTVRTLLHRAGYRFRLHVRGLPGKPDIVLPKHNAVIFVHGCFWHGHGCNLFKWPTSNAEFWKGKIHRNKALDSAAIRSLRRDGWRVLLVWECSMKGPKALHPDEMMASLSMWLLGDAQRGLLSGRRSTTSSGG
jgi:DNA mismatch endonuclease (patch repair protein)